MKNGKIKLSKLAVESFTTSIDSNEVKGGIVHQISGARGLCSVYTKIAQCCGYLPTVQPCAW